MGKAVQTKDRKIDKAAPDWLAVKSSLLNEREGQAARNVVAHAVEQGADLIEVRDRIGARKFKPWIETNLKFSRQTAYGYIKLAENRDTICKARLQITSLAKAFRLISEEDWKAQHRRYQQEDAAASVQSYLQGRREAAAKRPAAGPGAVNRPVQTPAEPPAEAAEDELAEVKHAETETVPEVAEQNDSADPAKSKSAEAKSGPGKPAGKSVRAEPAELGYSDDGSRLLSLVPVTKDVYAEFREMIKVLVKAWHSRNDTEAVVRAVRLAYEGVTK